MVSNSEDTHDHFKIPMLAILPWQLGTQVKRAQLWSNNIHDKTIRCQPARISQSKYSFKNFRSDR